MSHFSDGHPDPKIGPQVYLGPIKIMNIHLSGNLGSPSLPKIDPLTLYFLAERGLQIFGDTLTFARFGTVLLSNIFSI